ncbi:MAG: hypothetical protein PHD32_02620 [Eubacteriales bacterium]|nr:hypothetical protein [Eubacteriales bacterium]
MQDREILRELAEKIASVAALPQQAQTRELWRALNDLTPRRPMVAIDQVCWNELENDELRLRCELPENRRYEQTLRRTLYQWNHFPVDMVVDDILDVEMAIRDTGFGLDIHEETRSTEETSEVLSHLYLNQLSRDEDLEKIHMPRIAHDAAETQRRLERAHGIFDGILRVEPRGAELYLSVWDPASQWLGMEGLLYALIDRPEFMLALAHRMVKGYLLKLDQLEAQGLLPRRQPLIHCTGAYTDALPAPGWDPARPRTQDLWMFGLAQPFASASPAMFEEFEIGPCLPLFERFGRVYYGCCDPLDRKMDAVKRIPHLRKVSVSPWANEERCAQELGSAYVFSRKPNPALLAWPSFDEKEVRDHLTCSRDLCRQYGCPLELILKDISTVGHDPTRLEKWARIAMDIAQA